MLASLSKPYVAVMDGITSKSLNLISLELILTTITSGRRRGFIGHGAV
jgi:hypothetical protein